MNPPEMHSEDDPEFNEPETSTGSGTIQDLLKEIRRRRFQQQASYDQGERADTVSEEIGEQAPPDSGIEAHAEDESYQREVVDDAGGESSPSLEEDSPELSRMESASDARDFQDLLGELRRRSLQQQTLSYYEEPAAPEIVAEQSWRAPEAEADEDDLLEPESEVADSSARLLEHFSQEIQGAVDDLSQEVRRVGRELFKTNRAADRNGELFEQSLREMQRLTEAIARIPDKFDEKSSEAVFQAKASLCQDLFRVVDAMEASLSSAEDVLARIRKNAEHSPSGFSLMMMRSARELRQMLMDSVEAMSRWIEGQSLLVERVKGALQAAGARVIECEGQMFNPALHRAIAVERRSGAQAGTILKCELKGYTLDGKILRYAEVVVAKDEQGSRN